MKRASTIVLLLGAASLLGACNLIGATVNTAARLAVPVAGAKLAFGCLPEGTPIDTPAGRRPVETLRPGEVVTGHAGAPVRILRVEAYLENPRVEFLAVAFDDGAVVEASGMHRIDGVPAQELVPGRRLGERTVVAVTRRRGVERSFDLLTEDRGYRIGGVPVDSMIAEMAAAAAAGAKTE